MPPFLVEQDGAGGSVDLTEVNNRLDGLDNAITQIGNEHNQLWTEIDALKQGGGADPLHFEDTAISLYSNGDLLPDADIQYKAVIVNGHLSIHMGLGSKYSTYRKSSAAPGNVFAIVPEKQPKLGTAGFTRGVGAIYRGSKAYWIAKSFSRWVKMNDGKWGIEIIMDNEHPAEGYTRPAWGQKPWSDRYPWTVGGGSAATVNIQIPGR